MTVDTNTIVSISEANQNFLRIAKMVDQYGQVIIMKNNVPKYVLTGFEQADQSEAVSEAELKKISDNIKKRNRHVYEELAK